MCRISASSAACLRSPVQPPLTPLDRPEAPGKMQEPSLVWSQSGRTTNLNSRKQTAHTRSHLHHICRTSGSRCPASNLLTVLVLLNNFHLVSSKQINFVFGRLGVVSNHSVHVQYDGAGNFWVVQQINHIQEDKKKKLSQDSLQYFLRWFKCTEIKINTILRKCLYIN